VDVRGKIVLVRYGKSFRGVKAFVAQEHAQSQCFCIPILG